MPYAGTGLLQARARAEAVFSNTSSAPWFEREHQQFLLSENRCFTNHLTASDIERVCVIESETKSRSSSIKHARPYVFLTTIGMATNNKRAARGRGRSARPLPAFRSSSVGVVGRGTKTVFRWSAPSARGRVNASRARLARPSVPRTSLGTRPPEVENQTDVRAETGDRKLRPCVRDGSRRAIVSAAPPGLRSPYASHTVADGGLYLAAVRPPAGKAEPSSVHKARARVRSRARVRPFSVPGCARCPYRGTICIPVPCNVRGGRRTVAIGRRGTEIRF